MSRKLSPGDFLSYVLVGDWNSDRYSDLDPGQVGRLVEVLLMIAEQCLVATVELPSLPSLRPRPPGNASLN
jgi:hypothetical protein